MNRKEFKVHKPTDLPPVSLDYPGWEISDRFVGKAKTICGEVEFTIARYDFSRKKWCFSIAGHKELIEYYTE